MGGVSVGRLGDTDETIFCGMGHSEGWGCQLTMQVTLNLVAVLLAKVVSYPEWAMLLSKVNRPRHAV